VDSSFGRIQNSKFKIQNLIRGECLRKKWQKLEKPYSSWVLACCQFQDSVELIVDSLLGGRCPPYSSISCISSKING